MAAMCPEHFLSLVALFFQKFLGRILTDVQVTFAAFCIRKFVECPLSPCTKFLAFVCLNKLGPALSYFSG